MLKYIFLIICFSTLAFASPQTDFMVKGNALYKKGDFEGAIKAYESVLNSGFESSSLYYNLGNAYYRDGKIGYALLYFEKAKKLSPGDEDINHNIALLNTRITDRIAGVPRFFLFQWWDNLLELFSVNGWTWFTYSIFISFLVIIAAYYLIKSPIVQKYLFFSGTGVLFVLILSIILLSLTINREHSNLNGVITSNYVNVKLSPDEKSGDSFIIHEGLKVRLEDKVENWIKIRLRDGKLGWIKSESVKLI